MEDEFGTSGLTHSAADIAALVDDGGPLVDELCADDAEPASPLSPVEHTLLLSSAADVAEGEDDQPHRWTWVHPSITVSRDGSAAVLSKKSALTGFPLALAPGVAPGAEHSFELVIGNDQGAVRSVGVTAFSEVAHRGKSPVPPLSIAVQNHTGALVATLLGRDPIRDVPPLRRGTAVRFVLSAGGGCSVLVDGGAVASFEELPKRTLYPFACFYRDNVGNEVSIRRPDEFGWVSRMPTRTAGGAPYNLLAAFRAEIESSDVMMRTGDAGPENEDASSESPTAAEAAASVAKRLNFIPPWLAGPRVRCPKGHPLVNAASRRTRWRCSRRQCRHVMAGGIGVARWRCNACDYELCGPCLRLACDEQLRGPCGLWTELRGGRRKLRCRITLANDDLGARVWVPQYPVQQGTLHPSGLRGPKGFASDWGSQLECGVLWLRHDGDLLHILFVPSDPVLSRPPLRVTATRTDRPVDTDSDKEVAETPPECVGGDEAQPEQRQSILRRASKHRTTMLLTTLFAGAVGRDQGSGPASASSSTDSTPPRSPATPRDDAAAYVVHVLAAAVAASTGVPRRQSAAVTLQASEEENHSFDSRGIVRRCVSSRPLPPTESAGPLQMKPSVQGGAKPGGDSLQRDMLSGVLDLLAATRKHEGACRSWVQRGACAFPSWRCHFAHTNDGKPQEWRPPTADAPDGETTAMVVAAATSALAAAAVLLPRQPGATSPRARRILVKARKRSSRRVTRSVSVIRSLEAEMVASRRRAAAHRAGLLTAVVAGAAAAKVSATTCISKRVAPVLRFPRFIVRPRDDG